MNLGDLILNIIVKINDGDVKVNSLNDSLKLSENQFKSVSSTSVSLSGSLQNDFSFYLPAGNHQLFLVTAVGLQIGGLVGLVFLCFFCFLYANLLQ